MACFAVMSISSERTEERSLAAPRADAPIEYSRDALTTSEIFSLVSLSQKCSSKRSCEVSNRISTVIHLGNPYVLEELSYIPRLIISTASHDGAMAAIDTLAGLNDPHGIPLIMQS